MWANLSDRNNIWMIEYSGNNSVTKNLIQSQADCTLPYSWIVGKSTHLTLQMSHKCLNIDVALDEILTLTRRIQLFICGEDIH